MSSADNSRSSSAVRNLRSIFENKASNTNNLLTPESRGRSPNSVGSDKENGGRNKVRASFVAVEPVLKTSETIMAESIGSPANLWGTLGDGSERKMEKEPAKPDKPVAGAEEEPGHMKPADLSDEVAVSGGEALPPVAEDLRPTAPAASANTSKKVSQKTPVAPKPSAISTKPPPKAPTTTVKSPVSQPKTPLSAKATAPTVSPLAKRPSRSSLTAPTAASIARAGTADKVPVPTTKTSPTAKSKPRETTKPLNISSHLTAPTASSKAKHEPEATAAPAVRTTMAHRPKPQTSSTKPRTSLAAAPRPTSRDSSHSARRSLAPVDGSFLDRMTRPTAASANRTAEKVEAKSPPSKAKVAAKPKVNGAPKAAADPAVESPGLSFAGDVATIEDAVAVTDAGNETPTHTNGGVNPALEATPAALAVDDTIR